MIVIDEKYWPLVIFRFSEAVSMPQLETYLDRQEAMTALKTPTASLVLTRDLKMWEAPVLRRQAQWIKQHRDEIKRYSLGAALVIETPIVRGMLKALLWLQPMPQPHLVTDSIEPALKWLGARLGDANVPCELPAPADLG